MTVEPKTLEQLVKDIERYADSITTAGDPQRAMLQDIAWKNVVSLVPRKGDKLDVTEWGSKSEADRARIASQVERVCASVHAAAQLDGPPKPEHLMAD